MNCAVIMTIIVICSLIHGIGMRSIAQKFASMEISEVWSLFRDFLQRMRSECPVFGVLVVGETGAGKSTLINNLVGKEVVEVGHKLISETSTVSEHSMEVEGVPIVIYDTPGLSDTRGDCDKVHLQEMKDILKKREIHLVIYCMKLSETRMRDSLIHTFQEYNKIGVKWERAIFALTFADNLPVPSKEKKKPGFEIASVFNARVAEFNAEIARMLVERVGVRPNIASEIKCYPTTSDPDEQLQNDESWFVPLWLDILEILSPGAAMRFLEMHTNNIEFISEDHEDKADDTQQDTLKVLPTDHKPTVKIQRQQTKRMIFIIADKMKVDAKMGAAVGAITGGIFGIVAGPVGVPIGIGVGAGIGAAIGSYVGFLKGLLSRMPDPKE